MSKKRQPKTEGYTWLEHSFTAFNGSGYGDRSSPEGFVDSYVDYKLWKKQSQAVELAKQYYQPLLMLAEHLIDNSAPGRTPSIKGYNKFKLSRQHRLL